MCCFLLVAKQPRTGNLASDMDDVMVDRLAYLNNPKNLSLFANLHFFSPSCHTPPLPRPPAPLRVIMGGDHQCSVCQATFTRPQHVARHMRSRK